MPCEHVSLARANGAGEDHQQLSRDQPLGFLRQARCWCMHIPMMLRVRSLLHRFVRWYSTPAGLLGAVSLATVGFLAVFGQPLLAVLTLAAWVAFVIPHKFLRERRDWTDSISLNRAQLDEGLAASNQELGELGRDVQRVKSHMTKRPTTQQVKKWLRVSKEAEARRRSQMLGRMERLTSTAEGLERIVKEQAATIVAQQKTLAKLESEHRSLGHHVEKLRDPRTRAALSSEVQALSALYHLLDPGNELPPLGGWPISPEAALTLTRLIAREQPELIIETGSGSSTVLAAMRLAANGHGRIIALENDAGYARKTRQMLLERGLDKVATVIDAPLINYRVDGDDYLWYELAELSFDEPIDLVLVDGPPGNTNELARYPAVPLLIDYMSTDATVLADDAGRVDEQRMVEKWCVEEDLVLLGTSGDGDLAILRRLPTT